MVLGSRARGLQHTLFSPVARVFIRLGLSPNAVTIGGTLLTVIAALALLPTGHLITGSLVLGVLVLADSIDGIMARQAGRASAFGGFLDSTLDRLSDAAIFAGLLLWFFFHDAGISQVIGIAASLACLAFGAMVSYARAKAEACGVMVTVGFAERGDRISIALAGALLTGVGVPPLAMAVILSLLAALSLITVLQRILAARGALEAHNA